MSDKVRSSLHSLVIITVMIFSAMGTTIAYADGGTTPPTETTTECASDGTTNECSSGAVTVEEPAARADDSNSAGNQSNNNAAPAVQAGLNDVPANTAVAVVNAQGQAEPLASQAAADALATTSDPIWCPAAQTTPTPGANGCTTSFSSFNALLTFLAAHPATYQGAGTIYVQQGNYQGGESSINFNNYTLSNISNAALTIQGGWNTSNNTVDLVNGSSSFSNIPIMIGTATNPWGGNLTINNLTLNFNPTGQSGTGITVYSQGDINLTQVTVTNSATGAGAELNAGGNVTIKNSRFDRNKTAGAIIRSRASVAISDSSFSNPTNGRRQITGLDIVSDGSVSLNNVLANTNREAGATINAGGRVTLVNSSFSDTKAMRGSAFIGYGLQVVTPDVIDLDTVTANSNFLWGASLNAGGDIAIINSIFNANTTESPGFIDDTGLLIISGGNVAISGSHADDNRLIGATITAKGRVDISDSTFSSNNGVTLDSAGNQTFHGYGLQVVSTCIPDPINPANCTPGSVTLTRVVASNNTLFGAHLESQGDVTISGSDFSNQTTGVTTTQLGRGLEVISGGAVIIDTTTINSNQTFGANIQAGDAVFLDTVTATNNGTNGIEIKTNCSTLFLIDGTYTGNGQYGLNLTDTQLNQTGTPILTPNGAGGIFQNPTTCPTNAPAPASAQTDTTVVDSLSIASLYAPSSNGFSTRRLGHAAALGSVGNASNARNVTLNSFLANTTLAHSTGVGLFVGKYAYVHFLDGMQIFVYSPAVEHVAMLAAH